MLYVPAANQKQRAKNSKCKGPRRGGHRCKEASNKCIDGLRFTKSRPMKGSQGTRITRSGCNETQKGNQLTFGFWESARWVLQARNPVRIAQFLHFDGPLNSQKMLPRELPLDHLLLQARGETLATFKANHARIWVNRMPEKIREALTYGLALL